MQDLAAIIMGLLMLAVGGFVGYVTLRSVRTREKKGVKFTPAARRNTAASMLIAAGFAFVGAVFIFMTVDGWLNPKPKSVFEQYQAR